MIKENQKRLNNLAVLLDALVAVTAYLAAYFFVFRLQIFSAFTGPVKAVYSFEQYMSALLFLVPCLLCVYWVLRLYAPKRATQSIREVNSILQANLIVLLVFSLILFLMILLPLCPDDYFCYLSGITGMSARKFTALILLGKPWCILAYSVAFSHFLGA